MRLSNHLFLVSLCLLLSASCAKRLEPGTLTPEFEQQIPPPPSGDPKDTPIFFAYEKAPEVVYVVEPEYPKAALEDSIEGSVILIIVIDETGNILRAEVVRSTPPGLFDEAAITAVMQWRYKPATSRNVPIKVQIEQIVKFTLKKKCSY